MNVIEAKEVLLTETHLALVMEYAAGNSLTGYVADKWQHAQHTGLFLSEDEARYFFRVCWISTMEENAFQMRVERKIYLLPPHQTIQLVQILLQFGPVLIPQNAQSDCRLCGNLSVQFSTITYLRIPRYFCTIRKTVIYSCFDRRRNEYIFTGMSIILLEEVIE